MDSWGSLWDNISSLWRSFPILLWPYFVSQPETRYWSSGLSCYFWICVSIFALDLFPSIIYSYRLINSAFPSIVLIFFLVSLIIYGFWDTMGTQLKCAASASWDTCMLCMRYPFTNFIWKSRFPSIWCLGLFVYFKELVVYSVYFGEDILPIKWDWLSYIVFRGTPKFVGLETIILLWILLISIYLLISGVT